MQELHHEDADCKVDKSSYDCFVGTGLAHTLKQQGIDTVIVAGKDAEFMPLRSCATSHCSTMQFPVTA